MKDYQLLDDDGRATPMSNFLASHRGYRRDAARFPEGVRSLAEKGLPAAGLEALRSHWKGYDQVLLVHHQMEDNFLFPMYRAQRPDLAPILDELADQHTHLDEKIEAVSAWLAKLPNGEAVEGTVAAFEDLEAAVNAHLDLEEQHIVPLMIANPPMPPGPPAGAPPGGAPGHGGPGGPPMPDIDFAFAGPWLADGLDDATAAALLDSAPPPFKVDFDENRRRYEAQLTRWFGD